MRRGASQGWDGLVADALHIFVLWAFAVAQPLFDIISKNAAFLVAHRAQPEDVLLVALICLTLPSILVLIALLGGLVNRSLRTGIHFLSIWALVTLIALPPVHRVALIPGAAAVGGGQLRQA